MGMVNNRRGFITMMLIFFIFASFFLIIVMGVVLYLVDRTQFAFGSIDVMVGDVSFNESYATTLYPALNSFKDSSEAMGLLLILGMIIVMLIVGFAITPNRLWILLDIFIIVIAVIPAVYLAQAYETFITADPSLLNIYSVDLEKSGSLILNLPYLIPIAGILIMLVTYGITRKRKQEPLVFDA